MMEFLRKAAVFFLMLVLVIDIPIIVFSGFVDGVVLNDEFYQKEFQKIGLYDSLGEGLGMERPIIDENIGNFVSYLRGDTGSFIVAVSAGEMPEESLVGASPEHALSAEELGMPPQLLFFTTRIKLIRNASIGLALLLLVLTFIVYRDKSNFFRRVGKRIATSTGISLAIVLLLYLKSPAIAGNLHAALPAAQMAILFQDILLRMALYIGAVFAVGLVMYAAGIGLRKVFQGKISWTFVAVLFWHGLFYRRKLLNLFPMSM